jgi:adenylate cyclase
MISLSRRLSRRSLVSLGISLLWLLIAASPYVVWPVAPFERWLYDKRMAITAPEGFDRRVVIVDIDEASLAKEGYWPWGRDRVASLVYTLFDGYDVGLVAFDVVFTARDPSSGLQLLEELQQGWLEDDQVFADVLRDIRPALDWDRRFAAAMKNRDTVLGYYFSRTEPTSSGQLPPPVPVQSPVPPSSVPWVEPAGYVGVYGPLLEAARSAGYSDNPTVDPDGVHRRLPLLQLYQGQLYESLSLAVVRSLHGQPPVELEFRDEGGERELAALRIGGFRLPVDPRGRALVPYRGGRGSFPYVSAADVLQREVPPEVLRDAIVIVGTTSPTLADLRATPLERFYPGVEIHANMISGILDEAIRYSPSYAKPLELLQIVAIGLAMSLLLPLLAPQWSAALTVLLIAAVTGLNFYFWSVQQAVVPLASPYLLIVLLFLFHLTTGFVRERHMKGRLERRFGQYVPPALVERMQEAPGQEYGFSGEIREMTVLFADLRSFTSIAEAMPPSELTQFMHEWLTPMTDIIHRHGGTIDKYMGDCIMAFWGAPLADPNHAANALAAAEDMLARIPELNRQFARRGWPGLNLGIGINTGDMRVGNMGSEFRVAYTVLGDAVNLGSRLEELTGRYGLPLLVSAAVRAKAQDREYIEVDRVRVKGKRTPVAIYAPIGKAGDIAPELRAEISQYHRALATYLQQDWDRAEQLLRFLWPGSRFALLYEVYLERIDYYRSNPPGPAWNGVFTYASKQ